MSLTGQRIPLRFSVKYIFTVDKFPDAVQVCCTSGKSHL
ncbi:hypothetical protein [Escherichia coli IS5]|nr:hypothetical protein [Escherichia coli IS5]